MLSHYRLADKIGEGGMGIIFKALDTKLNRHVAIKILPPQLLADAEQQLRFQREAQAAAALSHPAIAVIYEVGEHEGAPFIAMELLEGKSLRDLIRQRPLSPAEWLRIALPMAEGLAHAHTHGVVHRDLKPDNVVVTGEHQVKILDFGLAKLLKPESRPGGGDPGLHSRLETISQELTRAGKVYGTVAYMSPEQARGEPVDHRSDLFSLGIMLYEMTSGRLPFKGRSQVETLHAVITDEPPPMSQVAGEVPAEIERVVRKAMEKEPDRRYQDAADLAADLRNLQRDLDSGRVTTTSGRVGTVRAPQRSRWLAAGAVLLAAVLLAAAGAFLSQRHRPEPGISPVSLEERSIAVIGFENLSDPEDSEHLGRMLMGLITTDLTESGGLSVVSMPKVLSALRQVSPPEDGRFDASVASEAARRAGADVMLVGQIGKAGQRLILTAELIDVATEKTLGSHQKQASSSAELFSLAGAIATEARSHLGIDAFVSSRGSFDLAGALTSDPDAYRQYTAGETALHQGGWPEAIERFVDAIKKDPTFALAYYRLGIAYSWSGNTNEAVATLREGLREIDRLPEHWQVVYRAYLDFQRGEHDASHEALDRLIQTSPDIPDAYYILGEITTHIARYRDPRRSRVFFEKALEIDPTFKVAVFHLIEDYVVAEDVGSARRLLSRLREESPDDPTAASAELLVLIGEGRLEAATALADELTSRGLRPVWFNLFRLHAGTGNWERAYTVADEAARTGSGYIRQLGMGCRGMARLARGQLGEGLAELRQAAAGLEAGELGLVRAAYLVECALVLEAAGDLDGAVDTARQAIQAEPYLHASYFYLGRVLLGAGRTDEAVETLSRLDESAQRSLAPMGRFWTHMLQAEIHLSKGNLAEAEREAAQVASFPPEHRSRPVEWLTRGRIKAASGDRSGAISAYRRALDASRGRLRLFVVVETRAFHALARLEEEVGDLASARQHYRDFLDRWGEADMPVKDATEAKSRLAILESR